MSGIYISYPFCAQKCSFCNFASGVQPAELESRYTDLLLREIGAHTWKWTPDTVYFGGGTPSRLAPAELHRILDSLPGRPWQEATLEAAPGSLNADLVRAWRDAGIDRVSLGVQSFVSRELAKTGRRHDAGIVARDCGLLRDAGIANFNIDLIAGLPYQTPETWTESLDWTERLQPPHVSVYLFEVDEDSRLGLEVLNDGRRYSAASVPDPDQMAELYETAVDRLAAMGIERYEISNFARPGFESIHNLKYWTGQPYVGFGADAHSFDGQYRIGNVETASDYVSILLKGDSAEGERSLSVPEEEKFFVGLRLMRGVDLTPAEALLHRDRIDRLTNAGLIQRSGSRIALTRRGVLLSNEVFSEFIDIQAGALT